MPESSEWFKSWFDTEWYHKLYCDRDESEAERFISNLLRFLSPSKEASILDLACGKGRHAIQIHQQGHQVWGIDLSKHNINQARKESNERLHFDKHDMREVYKHEFFDYIFNLFTSFGYFNDQEDNLKVMESVCKGLKSNGMFVLDFLNAERVKKELVKSEVISKGDTDFFIERSVENNVIVKRISFSDGGRKLNFEERVTAFEHKDLVQLFEPFNLEIQHVFGSYDLQPFNAQTSDRLIMIATKK